MTFITVIVVVVVVDVILVIVVDTFVSLQFNSSGSYQSIRSVSYYSILFSLFLVDDIFPMDWMNVFPIILRITICLRSVSIKSKLRKWSLHSIGRNISIVYGWKETNVKATNSCKKVFWFFILNDNKNKNK